MTLKELAAVTRADIEIAENGLLMPLMTWPILLDALGDCVIQTISTADGDRLEVELKRDLVRE